MNEMYIKNKWEYLSELNQHTIKLISEYIGINTVFVNSSDFNLKGDRVERLINLIKDMGGTEYISGPAAKTYLQGNEHLFSENNIKLNYKEYPEYPDYKQLREPFEQSVSIVDLIANIEQKIILKYVIPSENTRN